MVNFNIDLNLPAAIVAAVVTFALGGLWYSPLLFAKQWVAAHGFTPERVEEMRRSTARAYAITFVCWLVMSMVMSVLIDRIEVETLIGGLKVGGLCWAGFAVPIGLSGQVFSGRKMAVFVIDAGYQLLSLMVMGGILAVWQG